MTPFGQNVRALVQVWLGLMLSTSLALDTDQPNKHWAFQDVGSIEIPRLRGPSRARTAVDNFILARLQQAGLALAREADDLTLARRAWLDLIGLSPAPEDLKKFVEEIRSSGDRDKAYEHLVDQLLASPYFGERWGRHWLDAVGYVDVWGADETASAIRLAPGRWRYRDYVINAFNDDKPYDLFLREQIAGDEMVDWREAELFTPEIQEKLVATGFLRLAIDDTDQDVLNIPSNRYATLFDTMEIFGSSVLGLTLQCARCHSHKYDPIPQKDYYELMSFFTPALNPEKWVPFNHRVLSDIPPKIKEANDRFNESIDGQIKKLESDLGEINTRYDREKIFAAKLASLKLPESLVADTKAAVQAPVEKRNEIQKYLAGKFEAALQVRPEDTQPSAEDRRRKEILESRVAGFKSQRKVWGFIQAFYDTGEPPTNHVLVRGNFDQPGARVDPGFLTALTSGTPAPRIPSASALGRTSGRRLALADWLTQPGTPAGALIARVHVNRIWQHLFGRGIVETPGNLGRSGMAPTHPELLEWLASDFLQSGWRTKPVIRRIMLSSVYRQSSRRSDAITEAGVDPLTVDTENRLLWRMPLRRLESEIIRDSILRVSGHLDIRLGGEPVAIMMQPGGKMVVTNEEAAPNTGSFRRSVYVLGRRNYNAWILSVFDQPVVTTTCPSRLSSAVALQSLTLLNDPFLVQQARFLAERICVEAGADDDKRIEAAFWIAWGRPPTSQEKVWSSELIEKQTSTQIAGAKTPAQAGLDSYQHLCQMLLNASRFLYVE